MRAERSVYFLGVRFDGGSIDEAMNDILAAAPGRFKYVVTPNVQHMVRILDDPAAMHPLYGRAWRVYCDSRVLARFVRFNGVSLTVIPGSDLTASLIAKAAEQRLTVALVGPSAEAVAVLAARYPDLTIASHAPPMGFIRSEDEIQRCVDFVVETRASLTFLAVGTPRQEILASRIATHPRACGIGLCIGASIDFLTGKQRRAPAWLRQAGLEWLHRLLSNPWRLGPRYVLECPRIFYLAYVKRGKN
jgi:N-acetylglucosaminyldiphosphoundecaprenol N-acetyl-beta-D-mannosaminyltransferase